MAKQKKNKGVKAVTKKAQQLERLTVEYVPTDSLKPNDYNPNRQGEGDFSLLIRSIEEDGFTQPIVAQASTRVIVDGEHRWRAARQMNMETVPVVFVDMTEEQRRIATLRHNRARGSEDMDAASQVLRDLRELGALDWAADSLNIDDDELQRLIDDVPAAQALAGEDFSQAWAPARGETQEGVAAQLGTHSMTASAKEKLAENRFAMAAAPDEATRTKLEHASRQEVARVVVMYRDSEAEIVRSVLEPKPAERVLELCRLRLADAG